MPDDVITPAQPETQATPATSTPEEANTTQVSLPQTFGEYLSAQQLYKPSVRMPWAEKKQLLDGVKPKNDGDFIALTTAKTVLKKQKPLEQTNEQNLGNRILKQKADVLNQISKQYGLDQPAPQEPDRKPEDLSPTEFKELAESQKEFRKQLQKLYDIPQSALHENIILPVPSGWNAPELKAIKRNQPAWTGEYIQLRKDPATGQLSWEGYNKPTAGTQTLSPAKVIADTYGKKWDGKKWVVSEPGEKDVKGYWDKVYNATDYSDGALRLHTLLKDEEAEGNYRLTKLLNENPKLEQAYKNELQNAAPEDVSTAGGNVTLLQNAINKTYDLDKKTTDVQKKYSDFQFNVAVDAYDKFNDLTGLYNTQQDAIATKILNLTESLLRGEGKGKELDRLGEIRAQIMRNPASVTEGDRKDYFRTEMDLIKAASANPAALPFIQQFNKNIDDYKTAASKYIDDFSMLSTKEGKAIIDLQQRQAIGYDLLNKSQNGYNYFPKLKEQIKKREQIDMKGSDHISNIKALFNGIALSFDDISRSREQIAQWLGIMSPNDVIDEQRMELPKYNNLHDILYTPNRPEQDASGKPLYANKISNFFDKAFEFSGTMTPYLLTGGTGLASVPTEMGMFFTSGYNDYYREGKEQGLNDQDAAIRGFLGGTALALTQQFIPKAQLVNRKAVTDELNTLLRQSTRPDATAISGFLGRFVNPEVLKNTYKGGLAVLSNDVAQNLINNYYNVSKGTKFQTDLDLNKVVNQSLMFGVNASLTNAIFKGSSKAEQKSARDAFMSHAERYPVETMRAVDDAIALSFADDHYDRAKLLKLKTDIATMHSMQFPEDFTQDQRVASWALRKQKQEWQSDMEKQDEEHKGMYENKIQEIDSQIREIATDPAKAEEYLNKQTEPLYRRLEKQGYFDDPNKNGNFVLVRHGKTEGNVKGVMNTDDEPLNAEGIKVAQDKAQELKDAGYVNVAYGPHTRQEQTADIIIGATGGKKQQFDDLKEWDRGKGPDADFDYKYWTDEKHANERPPGAGESFNEFLGRVQQLRNSRIKDNTAIVTSGQVIKLWESLDKSGGKWDEKAKNEFLKDSNDFDNLEMYSPSQGKRGDIAEMKTAEDEKTKETKGREGVLKSPAQSKQTSVQEGAGETKVKETAPSKAQLKREKEAKVNKLLSRDPESPEEAILQHFVRKGKVSQEQFIRSSGFGGKEKSGLNIDGGKQRGGKELIAKKWGLAKENEPIYEYTRKRKKDGTYSVDKRIIGYEKPKQIDEFAEELADRFGGDSKDYEQLIVDMLLDHTKDQMIDKLAKLQGVEGMTAEEIENSKAREYSQKDLTEDESREYDEFLQDKILKQLQDLPDNVQKELLDLVAKYQDKDGNIDWQKMEDDMGGFDPAMLNLSPDADKALTDLINKNLEHETESKAGGESADAGDKGKERKEAPGTTAERTAAVEDKYGKPLDDIIKQLKDEGRLKIECPPGMKRRFSLKDLLKRKT